MAYLTRYGHQPISEIERLTYEEAEAYMEALADIVRRENPEE